MTAAVTECWGGRVCLDMVMSFRLLAFWDRDLRGLFGVSFLTGRDGPAPRACARPERRGGWRGADRKRRTEKAACRGPRQQSQRAVDQARKGAAPRFPVTGQPRIWRRRLP